MKTLLLEYAAYHIWANEQLYGCIKNLNEESWTKEITSSFPSLLKTLLHMWDAESLWWQRIQGKTEMFIPSKNFHEHPLKGAEALLMQGHVWKEWLESTSEAKLNEVFSYTNLKGLSYESSYSHLLMHLFNHGTYHRGQLVTILRQLGVTDIPATDFIVWSRGLNK
ncbi:DinB family protein [Flavihumibacter cheonanensis]|uniref:DinB family protein n=1 Tax=Flavihumibacter cheonanensis TaxID=1442385 RepID=UPI001EF86CCF|nr:DinB family protein [Flavihumibacter cheonanensis]MCG7752445.1 DinB family protein [Flavihumibacter cheonanensis]